MNDNLKSLTIWVPQYAHNTSVQGSQQTYGLEFIVHDPGMRRNEVPRYAHNTSVEGSQQTYGLEFIVHDPGMRNTSVN